jgi:hypothetical protein
MNRTPGLVAPFVAVTEIVGRLLVIAGASLRLALTGPGRSSAEAARDLPRHWDFTRHSRTPEQAHVATKATT